jgi:hypothetical protein
MFAAVEAANKMNEREMPNNGCIANGSRIIGVKMYICISVARYHDGPKH